MIWVQNNQITARDLRLEQPNNSTWSTHLFIFFVLDPDKVELFVVVNQDHVELFGCSGPRPCAVIWLFWTKTMCSYLVVLNPDHVELFGCCGPRQSGVIWLF
jgi:hypothetical protein